jgi:hypothetical protein
VFEIGPSARTWTLNVYVRLCDGVRAGTGQRTIPLRRKHPPEAETKVVPAGTGSTRLVPAELMLPPLVTTIV